MKKIILLITGAIAVFNIAAQSLSPQDEIARVLASIAANNTELAAYRAQCGAAHAANATGLSPENPEVEMAYLWGEDGFNRRDISVSQSLELPGVYSRRRAVADMRNREASAELAAQRIEILLRAKCILIDMSYYSALRQIMETRYLYADTIMTGSSAALEQGEITIIDYNKAALNLTLCRGQMERANIELERLGAELQAMNGGREIVFRNSGFEPMQLPENFEKWIAEHEEAFPQMVIARSRIDTGKKELSLAGSQRLPKFSIGYQGEFVHGGTFQGVTLGISLPLWENRGQMSAARAAVIAAEMEHDNAATSLNASLHADYIQALRLNEIIAEYMAALHDFNSDELTIRAYRAGQISLHEYADQMQYTLELRTSLLETQRELAVICARLYAFEL